MSTTQVAVVALALLIGLGICAWAKAGQLPLGRLANVIRWTGLGMASVLSIFTLLAIVGWTAPDATDRMSPSDRALVEPPIDASFVCGSIPFARVLEIHIDTSRPRVRFRCGISHFGMFAMSGVSECIGGYWNVGGVFDTYTGDRPC